MKKFNWKALLIVVLALVMVFALVACNGDKDKTTNPNDGKKPSGGGGSTNPPASFTTSEFFGELWEGTKGIGDEVIGKTNNVYLKADLDIELGTSYLADRDDDDYTVDRSTKLGLALEAIVDRTTANSAGTILKVQLYSGAKNILALTFAVAEPENIYIDFGGQKILLPLHVQVDEETDNSDLGAWLHDFLTNEDTFKFNGMTIDGIVQALVGEMGEDWDLDNFVNGLLNLLPADLIPGFNLTPEGIAEMIEGNSVLSAFSDVILKDGKLSIGTALQSDIAADFFTASKNGNVYTAKLSSDLSDMLAGMIGNDRTDALDLSLSFEKDANGGLKNGLQIKADVFSDAKELTSAGKTDYHPFAAITIKDLEFGNAAAHSVNIAKAEYTTTPAIDISEKLSFDGIKLNGEELGDIEVALKGTLDITTADIATNKTAIEAYVSYTAKPAKATASAEEAPKPAYLLHATFTKGRLAVTIDRTATIGTYPVINMLVNAFGDAAYNEIKDAFFKDDATGLDQFANAFFTDENHTAIKDDFKGALWTGISPKSIYEMAADAAVKGIKDAIAKGKADGQGDQESPAPEADSSAEAPAEDAKKKLDLTFVIQTIITAFNNFKSLEDGKIELASDDVLQAVCDVANTALKLSAKDEKYWTVAKSINEAENGVIDIIAGMATKDYDKKTDEEKTPIRAEVKQMIEDTLKSVFADKDDDITIEFGTFDMTKKGTEETHLHYLLSQLLTGLKADVTLNFAEGLKLEVQAQVLGAKVSSTTSIGMLGSLTVTDLAADVTAEASNGWIVFDMAPTPAA